MTTRTHGGPNPQELAALGLRPDEVDDFSVNVNPYGPSASMRAAIARIRIDTYPDPAAHAARQALAQAAGVPWQAVALGPGAATLLWDLARLCIRPGTPTLICAPTFAEFPAAAHSCGAQVSTWQAAPQEGFALNLEAIAHAAANAEVVYLCSPNTPTGAGVSVQHLAEWAAHLQPRRIVLDQSFLPLSTHHADHSVAMPPNVVRVRSLTKEHALCGVRVGYALADADTIAALDAMRPAWPTSAQAQAAACQAPLEHTFVDQCRTQLLRDAATLQQGCAELGLRTVPSTTPFFLLAVRQPAALRQQLLVQHRILVRDCTSFGLPHWIRIGTRHPHANQRLLQALGSLVSENPPCP